MPREDSNVSNAEGCLEKLAVVIFTCITGMVRSTTTPIPTLNCCVLLAMPMSLRMLILRICLTTLLLLADLGLVGKLQVMDGRLRCTVPV